MRATKNSKTKRYQLCFKGEDGKRYSYTSKKYFKTGLTRHEADKIADQIYSAYEQEVNRANSPSLSSCVARMLQHKRNTKVKDVDKLEDHANRALQWDDNNTIEDIVTVAIKMRDDMLKAKKPNGEPYSPNYIKKLLDVYTSTANLAFKEWYILDNNIAGRIRLGIKLPPSREVYLKKTEVTKLLGYCDLELASTITFLLLTGLRFAELERLHNKSISGNTLTIDGKIGRKRSFPIADEAVKAANIIGLPISFSYDMLNKAFTKARTKADLTHVRIHDLRHTFATWIRQDGNVPLDKLQVVLGHLNIDQTSRYAHLNTDDLKDIASMLTVKEHDKSTG